MKVSKLFFCVTVLWCLYLVGCNEKEQDVLEPEMSMSMGFGGGATRGHKMMASAPAPAIEAMSADTMATNSSTDSVAASVQEKKVTKNGSMTLYVNSLSKQTEAKNFVYAKAKEFKATFDREDEQRWENQASLSMTAKIPADKFESFVDVLSKGPFTISHKSIYVTDVTERYIDLDVRLKNKKELREKYLSLLKKADKVKDVLDINKSIESVTSDIESLEGQFRYLKNQIAQSTLHITITAELPETMKNQKSFFQDIGNALYTGINRIRNFIIGIVALWPFIVVICGLLFGIRLWFVKRKTDD